MCPKCADKMCSVGIKKIAKDVFEKKVEEAKAKKAGEKVAYGWDKLPKGWTKDSVKKFWSSLTGDRKHKVTACHKKMVDQFGDDGAWAFCSSLNDMIEGGTDWRGDDDKKTAGKKKQIQPLRNQPDYNEGRMQDAIEDLEKQEEKLIVDVPQNKKYTEMCKKVASELMKMATALVAGKVD